MSFHSSCTGHGILPAHPKPVNEQTGDIHCHPSRHCFPPHCSEKNCAEKHDQDVLNHPPASTDPISDNPYEELSKNDTDDFEIVDTCDFIYGANGMRLPTVWPNRLKQTGEISDREQSISFDK